MMLPVDIAWMVKLSCGLHGKSYLRVPCGQRRSERIDWLKQFPRRHLALRKHSQTAVDHVGEVIAEQNKKKTKGKVCRATKTVI